MRKLLIFAIVFFMAASMPVHASSVSGGDAAQVEEETTIDESTEDVLSDQESDLETEASDQYNLDVTPVVEAINQSRNDIVNTVLYSAFMISGVVVAIVIWGVKLR